MIVLTTPTLHTQLRSKLFWLLSCLLWNAICPFCSNIVLLNSSLFLHSSSCCMCVKWAGYPSRWVFGGGGCVSPNCCGFYWQYGAMHGTRELNEFHMCVCLSLCVPLTFDAWGNIPGHLLWGCEGKESFHQLHGLMGRGFNGRTWGNPTVRTSLLFCFPTIAVHLQHLF
jgi:hypothetical protein